MKKLHFFLVAMFITSIAIAQTPKTINYQAVARNSSGQAVVNQAMKVRLSINKGATTLYTETRAVTTNALGLFNVQIGSAGPLSSTGDFATIYWLNNTPDAKVLKVELDINNTNNFVDMGSQALSSVPYSFAADYAMDAVNIGGHYVDTNTPSSGNVLTWNGSAWAPAAPTTGNTITTYPLFGQMPNVAANSTSWVFLSSSQFTTITVTAGQTINASIATALGTTSITTATNVGVSVCYQNTSGGAVTPFHSTTFSEYMVGTIRSSYSSSSSIKVANNPSGNQIAPGTYKIGLGIRNNSNVDLNNNDYMNGYIMVY